MAELSNVRSLIIFWSREGLTSINIDNSTIFPNQKKYNDAFVGVFFENTRKNFKSNLVLVFFLVLESKGL